MKYLIISAFLFISLQMKAQDAPVVVDNKVHKMVMQFTVGDSTEQSSVVLQVANIRQAWPKAQIEVVCHSSGLNLLIKGKSKVASKVEELSAQGIVFAACNNTMRRMKIGKDALLPTAVVVPSAMVELVLKQEDGWAYVKAAH
jgi:intracellular sulfur oxidation DsrE/DsrF family protein